MKDRLFPCNRNWAEELTPQERECRLLASNFGCIPASTLRSTLDALHTRPFAFLYTFCKLVQFVSPPDDGCILPRRIPAFDSKGKLLVARTLVRAKGEITKCAEYWNERAVPTESNTWGENLPPFPEDEETRRTVARWFGAIYVRGDLSPHWLFTGLEQWEDCLVVLARECSFFGQAPDCLPILEERLLKNSVPRTDWGKLAFSQFAKHRLPFREAWWHYCVMNDRFLGNDPYETGKGRWRYPSRRSAPHKSAPVFRYARKPPFSSRVNPLLNSEK